LTQAQIEKLNEAVRKIEEYYCYPVDVEYAVDASGVIFILQARPVARLQNAGNYQSATRANHLNAFSSTETAV